MNLLELKGKKDIEIWFQVQKKLICDYSVGSSGSFPESIKHGIAAAFICIMLKNSQPVLSEELLAELLERFNFIKQTATGLEIDDFDDRAKNSIKHAITNFGHSDFREFFITAGRRTQHNHTLIKEALKADLALRN